MGTPRSVNQVSGGVRRAMPASLHLLVNGYFLSICDWDWGIGGDFQPICRDVVEIGAEAVAQGYLEAKQSDLRSLPTGEGA